MKNESMLTNLLNKSVSTAQRASASKESQYKHLYITTIEYLTDIQKKLINGESNVNETMQDIESLGMFNVRVLNDYDPAYSRLISKLVHMLMAKFNMLDDKDIENNREDGLNTINKALLEYQIASSETRTPSLYSEPLQDLETMKDLLVSEKWPEPIFPETTALTTFIHHNKTELSESLIDATEKAVKNFDEYYDYLDPSYRQSN